VDASPSGIITFDYESRIDTINPAGERLLRVRGTEIIGRKLQEMGIEIAAELAAIPVGASRILSLGGWRRLQCAKSEFRDRGFPREFIMIEELTEALRLSEKSAYEKLIRLMSHEVNNTVAAANSLLHSCLHYAGQLKSEDQRDFQTALNAVIARSGELNRFMREFAEVARIPNPKPHSCSLIGLLEQVRVFLEQELARRRIVWRWDASDDPFPVLLDRGQMEQVFVNIIRNAMEAIDEDGTITVRIDRTGSHLWVAIEDSGPGILPEHREQLFTPFFSTKQNGQGIGLTLVREILENHGFEFRLESQAGGPTRFIIFPF
jgi:signal transduction histidine kinase